MVYNGLWGTTTAQVFTSLISAVFVFSVLVFFSRRNRAEWVVSMAPGLLTTLGLFGTFWGVAQSLGLFDVSNIDASVINLLDGMKLAFWTSILGMFYAFLLNFVRYVSGCFSREAVAGAIGAKDIHSILLEEHAAIRDLRDAIGGDKDTSLLSQIQKLRTETSDMKQSLLEAFNSFAEKVTENNSKALIDALREVISDFNAKINEQFGDNFKELNHAVGALLSWQENYRLQIETLVNHFQTALDGVEEVRKAISNIREHTDSIPQSMEALRVLIDALHRETEKAQELLSGFSALRNQAEEVFPSIERGMNALTEGLVKSVGASVKVMEHSVNTQNATIERLGLSTLNMALHTEQALKQGMDGVQSMFKKALEEIESSTKKSFETLDKEMENSLESVIRALGSKLASVSEKLVSDYQVLTQKVAQLLIMVQQQKRSSE